MRKVAINSTELVALLLPQIIKYCVCDVQYLQDCNLFVIPLEFSSLDLHESYLFILF